VTVFALLLTKLYKLAFQLKISFLAVASLPAVWDAMEDGHLELGNIGLKLDSLLEIFTMFLTGANPTP
jgi:hypothetical protein